MLIKDTSNRIADTGTMLIYEIKGLHYTFTKRKGSEYLTCVETGERHSVIIKRRLDKKRGHTRAAIKAPRFSYGGAHSYAVQTTIIFVANKFPSRKEVFGNES